MFDLPSMLGEYLLPLLIVVPLALVLLLLANRGGRDDATTRKAAAPWTPPASRVPASAMAMPRVEAPPVEPPVAPPAPSAPVPSTPFVEPLAPATPASVAEASAAAAGLPLLVVDDSAVVRAKLSKLLASAGYSVTLARHGAEALELVNQHWFSVMITDLEMPEMDGFELIGHVSNDLRTENLPIIAITGHEALQAKVQDAKGLFGIFKKPWNDRELLARVAVLTQLRPRA